MFAAMHPRPGNRCQSRTTSLRMNGRCRGNLHIAVGLASRRKNSVKAGKDQTLRALRHDIAGRCGEDGPGGDVELSPQPVLFRKRSNCWARCGDGRRSKSISRPEAST